MRMTRLWLRSARSTLVRVPRPVVPLCPEDSMPARRAEPAEPYRRPRLRKSPEEAASLIEVQIKRGRELAVTFDPMRNPSLFLSGKTIDDVENDIMRWSSFNSELLGCTFDTEEVAYDYCRSGGLGG